MYVTQYIAQKVNTATVDGSDSEVEVCSKRQQLKWTKSLDKGKHTFCMALAFEDSYSDLVDANDDDVHAYKKEAKKSV